ncbi:hypothetical protein [Mycolicibacterium palauense]|uniref:hypothetical protein n=1 Tax=Mycolicibacterium palauense TaxID=2034511 RepID=UPI000BFEDD60|nr:hypothetical protein [Mycolicibacterium palauense]
MNPYPLSIIEKFVTLRWTGDHGWDAFFYRLEEAGGRGVWIPGVGDAVLIEADQDFDQSWFVFSIRDYSEERFFKVTSKSHSFGGVGHGHLEEVRGIEMRTRIWEAI